MGNDRVAAQEFQFVTFLGSFRHTVDEKLRVAFPSRFRDQLATTGQVTLYTVARKSHVLVFPPETWQAFVANLFAQDSAADSQGHDYLRRQVALGGEICRLDAQGRISLRADQLETAGIERDCVVFGNLRVVELWDAKAFEAMATKTKAQDKEDLWLKVVRTL
jgi:MraZ protein